MTAPRYLINSALPVLLRPDGAVQVGWHPRRAVLVRPPRGLTAAALAGLLRRLQAGLTIDDLRAAARQCGTTDDDTVDDLVAALLDAGVLTIAAARRDRSASIRIHGRGPLSDLLVSGLRCSGARVQRSNRPHAAVGSDPPDLVVLSDALIADPHVVRNLHAARVAHLAVRVRDGTGLVGPLVLPGVTSCLNCADLHRGDRDAAWPAVAAQLRDTVGNADRATVLATAALALNQIDRVIRAVREAGDPRHTAPPPPALDTTLEFDVDSSSIVARRWSRHPRCSC
jgi:hypothetical protein